MTSSRFSFVTERPVAITMFMVAIAVFGIVSLGKLPVDLLPEISYPTLTVRTQYPGAAPEDVEDRVSERIQEALSTLPGLVRTTSVSRANTSDVVLDFDWGTEMSFAVQDVRDKLDSLFLPQGVERPLILRYDPNLDPILRFAITPPPGAVFASDRERQAELIRLRWLAENRLQREIEALPGVAAVQVRGGLEEEIRVLVDPYKMAAQSLDPALLAQRLSQENLNASGGAIREGSTEYLVRTLNEFQDVEEIADLALVRRGDSSIRIRDIATVVRGHREREVVTRVDSREAVEIAIFREAGAKIVDIAELAKDRVLGTEEQRTWAEKQRERIAEGKEVDKSWGYREKSAFLAWRWRDDLDIELLSDQSTFIRAAVDDVKQSALLGAVLAIAIMWLFLRRLSATVIVGLAIPISVIVTFAPMYLFGVSMNIMSLGGLALGVGMLVDNAIVVLESITRCREEGDSITAASVRGVREVAGAIVASTLTTVAVFAPIVFVHGIAGQIFGDQAVTVVSALLVSLLVAVLFIPMLASRRWLVGAGEGAESSNALRPKGWPAQLPWRGLEWRLGLLLPNLLTLVGRSLGWIVGALATVLSGIALVIYILMGWILWPVRYVFEFFWGTIERSYPPLLKASLRLPLVVIFAAAGLSFWAASRVPSLGVQLLPEIHQGEFTAHVGLGVGTPLAETDRTMRALEREISGHEDVDVTALVVGVEEETLSREIEGEHTARLTVRMHAKAATPEREEALLQYVRRLLIARPDVRTLDFSRPTPFALESPIAVEVKGHDLAQLEEYAEKVAERMKRLPELSDVRTTVRPGHPEARVVFDRDKTLEYGLDLRATATLVRDQLLGNVSTRFVEGDERIDVRVLGDEDILDSLQSVMSLVINPSSETDPIPLEAIATVEIVRGPAEIRRIGNTRAIVVGAEGSGLDLAGAAARIEREIAQIERPAEVEISLGGQKREMEEGLASMRFALLLAIFLVYVVMASQFESLIQPLIIMLTVPLAGVGVVFLLDLLDVPLSVVVFIGLILLAGIVVNNAIVLVDRINARRAAGKPLREAVLEAGNARLRPILMTTLTTALGLLPMTGWLGSVPYLAEFGAGEGAEIRAPMAIAVIGGLLSSTLLTLIVIPVVYSLVYGGLRGVDRSTATESPPPPLPASAPSELPA